MAIRFYVDEDSIGLAQILAPLRNDLTYPGDLGGRRRAPSPIAPGTKDPVWLPIIGPLGWLVVTRDRRLRDKPAELAAIQEHQLKVATIRSREQLDKFELLEVTMCRWRDLEKWARLPGPFVYEITRTSTKKIV